jgi:hypothetical protein
LPTVDMRVSGDHPKYLGFGGILHTWPVQLAEGSLASASCDCARLWSTQGRSGLSSWRNCARWCRSTRTRGYLPIRRPRVGSSPLADVPCLPELPHLIRLKYLTEVNRWTQLRTPVELLADVTGGDLSRSLVWRELLHRYDIVDVASVVFRDGYGCWGFLELWRSSMSGRFGSAEAACLSDISGPVTTALRRSQARTFRDRAARDEGGRGPVMLLLSPHLDVLAQTAETEAYLRTLVPPDEDRSPIPASAYNVAGQLLATEAGVDSHAPMARVHLAGGRWLTLRAARMEDFRSADARDIAVTLEDSSPAERAGLFAAANALTSREGELWVI